jgi:hypothetical protein
MRLLEKSILDNGYAMPVVVIDFQDIQEEETSTESQAQRKSRRKKQIVDGFHKAECLKNNKRIRKTTLGYLPIASIRPGRWALTERMAATIQFNVHGTATVEGLGKMVLDFHRKGWDLDKIASEMGQEKDFVLRQLQGQGLAEAWKDDEMREAWELVELHNLTRSLQRLELGQMLCAEIPGEQTSLIVIAPAPVAPYYSLKIDGQTIPIFEAGESFLLTTEREKLTEEIEEVIQQHLPFYQKEEDVWWKMYPDEALWNDTDASMPE